MKNLRVICLLVAGLFLSATSSAQSEKQLREIRAFEQARYDALVKKDLPALASMVADELTYTHSNCTVEDKTEYLRALETGKYTFRSFETDSTTYHFLNREIVTAAGIVRLHGFLFEKEFKFTARFTAVYVKRKKRWQLAAWQTTRRP